MVSGCSGKALSHGKGIVCSRDLLEHWYPKEVQEENISSPIEFIENLLNFYQKNEKIKWRACQRGLWDARRLVSWGLMLTAWRGQQWCPCLFACFQPVMTHCALCSVDLRIVYLSGSYTVLELRIEDTTDNASADRQ